MCRRGYVVFVVTRRLVWMGWLVSAEAVKVTTYQRKWLAHTCVPGMRQRGCFSCKQWLIEYDWLRVGIRIRVFNSCIRLVHRPSLRRTAPVEVGVSAQVIVGRFPLKL